MKSQGDKKIEGMRELMKALLEERRYGKSRNAGCKEIADIFNNPFRSGTLAIF